ncbi:hypothetical protein BWQ96_09204 [Gracilariopsis chorda]|uniref:Uncharacterized protein n=1 Tax=Gracilariopsis chorda TaxID=448386 RepID=A0A2V3IG63_9FLOR|nr:hypothetical protein BWQ96_09204 [Gracilariopsis chorda]|eukprot:PXF41064.1 hypothetical protein BWQ96_09204 [Gracilariopsis chorda]
MSANATTTAMQPINPETITGNQERLTELGCLLGAFRDVSCSIGMDVIAVSLVPKPANIIEPQPQRPPQPLPKNSTRLRLKLIALIQNFCDNMFDTGYIVTAIQLKPVKPPVPGQRKPWEITVTFEDDYQHAMPPYPSRESVIEASLNAPAETASAINQHPASE